MAGTKLRTVQDRVLIQPPAEVLIQTDASTKDWGRRAMESQ